MAKVEIYTTRFCPYCVRAKSLLDSKCVDYKEFAVDGDPALRQEMLNKSGRRTVPQIWIEGQHIGGCDELMALEYRGRLNSMLVLSESG
ncbi:MAG: glutaredoxin 3 [Alteromonadaceae bacterium]|nr:MAG: glutaredoxin 3 [Alteromonadaceae bacterium]